MYSNLRHSKLFRAYMYVRLDGSAFHVLGEVEFE